MEGERHWIEGVYAILARLGVDPHHLRPNYTEGAGRVVLALPGSKVALALEGDRPEPLEEQGWFVTRMNSNQLQVLASTLGALETLSFEHVRRVSQSSMLKTGSKEEQRLFDAIIRAGVSEPDRNFVLRRPDGSELTVPDFTWSTLKLAFYMDGLWWHVSRDDTEMLQQLSEVAGDSERAAELMEGNRTRHERDSDNRSELQAQGWRVLSCTDRELETEAGVQKQVDRIIRLMRSIMKEQEAIASIAPVATAPSIPSLLDLL